MYINYKTSCYTAILKKDFYNSDKEVINIIRSYNADICLIYREKSDTCITSTIEAFFYSDNYLNLFPTYKRTLKRLMLVLQDIKGHTWLRHFC